MAQLHNTIKLKLETNIPIYNYTFTKVYLYKVTFDWRTDIDFGHY